MRKRRWLALSFVAVVAAVLVLTAVRLGGRSGQTVERGALDGLEKCKAGELALSRFLCDPKGGCARKAAETVTLKWSEGQLSARKDGAEVPVPLEQRASLLRDFESVEWISGRDMQWFSNARLVDQFSVRGVCDGEVRGSEPSLRIDLGATFGEAPLEWLPRALVLKVRGPGPRADALFNRLERLAR